jgi:TPR repeat protein
MKKIAAAPGPLSALLGPALSLLAALALVGCSRNSSTPSTPAGELATETATPFPAAPAKHAPYPFRRAVVLAVGIDRYPNLRGLAPLRYAEADAKDVADLFARHFGYEVVSLYGSDAGKAAIERTLRQLGGELGDGDVLVVYFAGHGVVIPTSDGSRAGYLIPADADVDANDVSDPGRWATQAIDMQRLAADVEAMNARHVLVIADSCCSGFMTTRGALSRADLKTFLFARSRTVLAATTESQRARENAAAGHGHFTAALLDELRRDDAMSVIDLFAPVVRRVASETNGRMTPTLGQFGTGEGTFVFIPRSIPRSEIEADLGGRAPATEPPRGLSGVAARQRERLAAVTTEAEAYRVMNTPPYDHSRRVEELRQAWEKRFTRFRENAAAGDPWGMAALSVCYSRGLGTPRNPELAYHWARQLDGVPNPPGAGRLCLAECYLHGWGVGKQIPAAEKLYAESAAKGFLPAEVYVAEKTLRRKSPTAADMDAARKIFERGRERKYPRAVALLAVIYSGTFPGVDPDPKRALTLFEEAAALGSTNAMMAAYRALATGGPGTAKDVAKAERYLTDAADLGDADALLQLAREYGTEKSERLLDLKPDAVELFHWALLAAEGGQPAAQCLVASCYATGAGTEKNVDSAKAWAEKAAAQNSADAFFLRGRWYASGTVLGPLNRDKAAENFARAAELGHPRASLAYVRVWRMPPGGFVYETGNWMEILRHASRAVSSGSIQGQEAEDLLIEAYKHLIQGDGTRGTARWERFEKKYPAEARDIEDRLNLRPK